MLLLRIRRDKEIARSLDFFYSLMLFLLVVILVLGSFAIERISQLDYPLILLRVLFSISGVMLALSWLWDPRAGFSGLGQLLSRYLLSVGMPFEQWLQRVATSADTARSSADFLDAAMHELSLLPWVNGGTWYQPIAITALSARHRCTGPISFTTTSVSLYIHAGNSARLSPCT